MHFKSYPYHQSLNLSDILFNFEIFKKQVQKENKQLKYISLNISLINVSENETLQFIEQFKVHILNKNHKQLSYKIKQVLKVLKIHFKDQTFNEIQFKYQSITYKDYISLDENKRLIKKMIQKMDK